jgi:high-affinity Fe2+/Pb2+ permease
VNPGEHPIRLCDHPRASRQIELARGLGGIGAFAFVGLVSLRSGLPLLSAGVRALLAGVLCYFACWGLAVLVWRHLAVAEADAARASAEARRAALLEEIERRANAVPNGGGEQ